MKENVAPLPCLFKARRRRTVWNRRGASCILTRRGFGDASEGVMLGHKAAGVLLTALAVLTLGGCIGVETTVSFADDGSGSAKMSYRVSQFVTKLGTAEGEQGGVPLPISAEDFRAAVADAPGVSIVGEVKRTEDEEDIRVDATLHFDRVESLAAVRGFGSLPSTLTHEGSGWTYRQLISEGGDAAQPVDADTMELVNALFAGYSLTFVVQAPADIKSANLGQIEGRTARYSVPVPELLKMTARTEWEVVW